MLDFEHLLQDITVDEADRALEVYKECVARGAHHGKALGCVWRAAQITRRLPLKVRRLINTQAVVNPDALGPIEPVEGGIFNE